MAYKHEDVIKAQYEQVAHELAQAHAEYEAGRIAENEYDTMSAANRIIEADQKRMALDRVVNTYTASQQPQAPAGADALSRRDVDLAKRYGLSPSDIRVAKGWTNDPNLSDEAKVKTYVENRQRLRQARADGSYRDDQGRISR
jgi:hypothetical protein